MLEILEIKEKKQKINFCQILNFHYKPDERIMCAFENNLPVAAVSFSQTQDTGTISQFYITNKDKLQTIGDGILRTASFLMWQQGANTVFCLDENAALAAGFQKLEKMYKIDPATYFGKCPGCKD